MILYPSIPRYRRSLVVKIDGETVNVNVAKKGVMAAEVLCCLREQGVIQDIMAETLLTNLRTELCYLDVIDNFTEVILGGEW